MPFRATLGPHTPAACRSRTPAGPGDADSHDGLVAYTLIGIWALTSGRTFPPGRVGTRPEHLPAELLIEFWADPAMDEEAAR